MEKELTGTPDSLDDERVTAMLDAMTDRRRAGEILALIATTRRNGLANVLALTEALDRSRRDVGELLDERAALLKQIDMLREQLFHAEGEATALRELSRAPGLLEQAARRAVVIGRTVRGAATVRSR
ncbi:MAG: hypothetical protein ABIQ39_02330 [Ilumatobacteraceae bacterium]